MTLPKMVPVESSNISHIGYDNRAQELHVRFKDGATHAYAKVPAAVHISLMAAESIGAHFHAHVRHKFESRRVGK